ncbi:hypothetical protein BC937DRAFT_92573 [Endogone sp. FLAS-F59071]|nr:hypothetical protein BC937DRAFT_92573 [Endogone sp. FLAS-F59071]|eukprot:RUS15330.1 hypothetical protein BC937DRAFT_92573 [Endogone sp. FLAS-F59071]
MQNLPFELLNEIFAYVGPSASAFMRVCRDFYKVSKDNATLSNNLLVRYGRLFAFEAIITAHPKILTPALTHKLLDKGAVVPRPLIQRLARDGLLAKLSGFVVTILYVRAQETYVDWSHSDNDEIRIQQQLFLYYTAKSHKDMILMKKVVTEVETLVERSLYCPLYTCPAFTTEIQLLLSSFPKTLDTYAKAGLDLNILPNVVDFVVVLLESSWRDEPHSHAPVETLMRLLRTNILVLSRRQFKMIMRSLNSCLAIDALRPVLPLLPFDAVDILRKMFHAEFEVTQWAGMQTLHTAIWFQDRFPRADTLAWVGQIMRKSFSIPDSTPSPGVDVFSAPFVYSFRSPIGPEVLEWIACFERNTVGAAPICFDHIVLTMAGTDRPPGVAAAAQPPLVQSTKMFSKYIQLGLPFTPRHLAWIRHAVSVEVVLTFLRAVEATGGLGILGDGGLDQHYNESGEADATGHSSTDAPVSSPASPLSTTPSQKRKVPHHCVDDGPSIAHQVLRVLLRRTENEHAAHAHMYGQHVAQCKSIHPKQPFPKTVFHATLEKYMQELEVVTTFKRLKVAEKVEPVKLKVGIEIKVQPVAAVTVA